MVLSLIPYWDASADTFSPACTFAKISSFFSLGIFENMLPPFKWCYCILETCLSLQGTGQNQQFSKFQWIKARVKLTEEKLSRPESHKIDQTSIQLLEKIPAGNQWGEREKYFLPYVSKSWETILENQEKHNVSLGAFKPKLVTDFIVEPSNDEWDLSQKGILNQTTLFSTNRMPLEKIPYRFRYKFICDDSRCNGHNVIILDWEVFESYRRWKRMYRDEKLTIEKLKFKWLTYFFEQRETYFVVGTDSMFGKFMILTIVSPKRKESQLKLDL